MSPAVIARFGCEADADGVVGGKAEVESGVDGQAVAVQCGAGDFEAFAAFDQLLVGVVADFAEGVFPAGAQARSQAHAVVQCVDFCRAQAEGTAEIVAGLPKDLQRRITTFFSVAVTLVTLVAEAGERFECHVVAAEVEAQFGEGLLSVGVVIAFEAIAESVERHPTFAAAVMAGVSGTQAQRQRASCRGRHRIGGHRVWFGICRPADRYAIAH